MEVKIKQGNEMLDATIEMVDGVMVVSPKEVKFEPNDGDIVVCESYGVLQLFICKKYEDECCCYCHCFYDVSDSSIYFNESESYCVDRYATEEEKKKLFDKLAEEGIEWKADTKELVTLNWKPKEGRVFWFPLYYASPSEFEPITSLLNKGRDKAILDKGWCFKTKEECQEFCNRLNEAINSVKP